MTLRDADCRAALQWTARCHQRVQPRHHRSRGLVRRSDTPRCRPVGSSRHSGCQPWGVSASVSGMALGWRRPRSTANRTVDLFHACTAPPYSDALILSGRRSDTLGYARVVIPIHRVPQEHRDAGSEPKNSKIASKAQGITEKTLKMSARRTV
jgi:hypothetical protein